MIYICALIQIREDIQIGIILKCRMERGIKESNLI